VLSVSGRAGFDFFSCIISLMNKRARKRLIEKIAKDKQEREKPGPEPNLSPPKPPLQQQRGFLPKPEKKRG
jgi:hypothetical protein